MAGQKNKVKQNKEEKKNPVAKCLLHTFLCRPGACTPDCPTQPPQDQKNLSAQVEPLGQGNGMAYLPKSWRETVTLRKARGKKVAAQVSSVMETQAQTQTQPTNKNTDMASSKRTAISRKPLPPTWLTPHHPYPQRTTNKPFIVGPPTPLSQTIRRNPQSHSSSPPASPRREEITIPRLTNAPSNSNLNLRLSHITLADMRRLPSHDAQEIRTVMREVERDRVSSGVAAAAGYATLPLLRRRASPSRHEVFGRSLQERRGVRTTQREVDERVRRIRNVSVGSHSSSLSLPRSWRVPEEEHVQQRRRRRRW
jgi:hypothetical protein